MLLGESNEILGMYSNNAQYGITVREQGQSKVYNTNCIYHKMLLTSAQIGS